MIKDIELQNASIIEKSYPLDEAIIELVRLEKWRELDHYFLEAAKEGGPLFNFMKTILNFNRIEHIIAIRSAPADEEGIWHDDGSRTLGFSLSLTENHDLVIGGELRFRAKGAKDYYSFSTRPLGQMLIFKTGVDGFEHMVSAVTSGRRVVIAGWCS